MDVQSNLEYLRVVSSCRNGATDWLKVHLRGFNAFERLFTELVSKDATSFVHRKIVRFSFRSLSFFFDDENTVSLSESITSVCYFSISITL